MPCRRRQRQAQAHQRQRQTQSSQVPQPAYRPSKERRSSKTSVPATPTQEPDMALEDAAPIRSAAHATLRPECVPGKKKEHRHMKRENCMSQRRRIWNSVPHNDQNNCNALSNINPIEPFTAHSTPFKTAATRKKPRPPSGPGLINDGAPWRIRTVDLGIRSPLLYPTELMEQITARPAKQFGQAQVIIT